MRAFVIFLLMTMLTGFLGLGQASYNSCQNALELCPGIPVTANNIDANSSSCVNCEDDFSFCFNPQNTIWFQFTTNATGGNVQLDFSNIVFEVNPGQGTALQAALIEATTPCAANTYTQIGSCHFNETTNFSLTAAGLFPGTTYYIIVDGGNSGAGITTPAEFTFDVILSGSGVDQIAPTLNLGTTTPLACENEIVTYTASLSNCPDTSDFNWFVNGTLAATTTVPFFQTTALSDGDVVAVSTTCYTVCPVSVQANAPPIAITSIIVDAGADITVDEGATVQLNGSTNAPQYTWSPAFLLSDENALNPFATVSETTTFSLTAENNGCSNTAYVTVFVEDILDIPNSFSPNGDNVNETWEIDGLELFPDNQMSIYTRWGQRIYQTSAYSKSKMWDGGNHAEGVYYYVLDLNDENGTQYSGTITLIR
jgi:gliding motility-associated-like protein